MRYPTLVFFACFVANVNCTAQCPAQLRQALFSEAGTASIRYYNAGTRVVREVQFILSLQEPSNGQMVLGSFSAKGVLPPRQERTMVFPYRLGGPQQGTMQLEIKRILFVDGDAWNASRDAHCTMPVQKARGSDAAR
jgi:hypothetical protein